MRLWLFDPFLYSLYLRTFLTWNSVIIQNNTTPEPLPGSNTNINNITNIRKITNISANEDAAEFVVRRYRDYYIKAKKITWDYLPAHENLADFNDEFVQETLINRHNRVGSRFSKYVYKEYSDSSFRSEIPKLSSYGLVGPLLHGEVGEVLRIHFRNEAEVPLSVHPHGVRYTKSNEGAIYLDGTNRTQKADDGVPPGSEFTYHWPLTSEFSPRSGDPNCLPFGYHSHVDADREVNAGLVGLLIVCKAGILNAHGVRSDVNREQVLYFDSVNEGESLLTSENLERCGNPDECKRLFESGDPEFEESLKKDSINGYMYGNLPNLAVCAGDHVAWYVFSLGAELHPVNIQGQTLIGSRHRKSVIGIWPATFREAEMVAHNPGRWLVQCMNSEHNRNGMKVFLDVEDCGLTDADQLNGRVRRFFLSTEPEVWDYAPSGLNAFDGRPLDTPNTDSEKYFSKVYKGKRMIGRRYKKTRFHQYTDINFKTRVPRIKNDEHLGILGPIIRAEIGDTIQVVLLNKTPFPVSIFLQGVSLESSQNGVRSRLPIDASGSTGRTVAPGDKGTYTFTVPWAVAPGDDDPDCLTYIYHSNADMERDVSSGLIGPLLVCKPGTIDPFTGQQKYVDREMFLYFSSIDENYSWYLSENVAAYVDNNVNNVNLKDEDFVESNVMRSVNGRSYGNLKGLDVCRDGNIVWHVLSFGQTEGSHVVTFNGNNVAINGVFRDTHVIISGQTLGALMKPNNGGNWSVYCHNTHHYDAGMTALYNVDTCGASSPPFYQVTGKVRRYYIAAVERKWDYSPRTIHPIDGSDYSDPSHAQHSRVQKDGRFIGSIYTKAVYREFTDATFLREKPRSYVEEHLGVLGPFIKAEVGDTVIVVFKNSASRPYSIHAQGLLYNKSNEGMLYNDGQSMNTGDAVPPGSTFTYTWNVPSTSGPTNFGQNCINFIYHSAVDPVRDVYSGLAGPIVVCRPGTLDDHGKRIDSVEKEFALLFLAFDENKSWYIQQNIKENCPQADATSAEFVESNKYDSINARIYNNVEGLIAKSGDNIAWYIMGLGESEDIHTVHFHGHTYTYRTGQTHEGDVIEVFPGTYETVEMFANNPGIWALHCHVGEHMRDGMMATYEIIDTRGDESRKKSHKYGEEY